MNKADGGWIRTVWLPGTDVYSARYEITERVAEDSDLQKCYVLSSGLWLTDVDWAHDAFIFVAKLSTNILLNVRSYL